MQLFLSLASLEGPGNFLSGFGETRVYGGGAGGSIASALGPYPESLGVKVLSWKSTGEDESVFSEFMPLDSEYGVPDLDELFVVSVGGYIGGFI